MPGIVLLNSLKSIWLIFKFFKVYIIRSYIITYNKKMQVEKYIPSESLKPFIKIYTFIESVNTLDNLILPDTSMILAIRYNGDIFLKEDSLNQVLPQLSISGLRKTARQITYSPKASNLLIAFSEVGLNAFSKIPANHLFGLNIRFEDIFSKSESDEILEKFIEAKNNQQRVNIIENFFIKKLINNHHDLVILNAINAIKHKKGLIKIKNLSESLNLSQDAFEKRFRKSVGSSAKHYASITRLKNIIKKYPVYNSLTEVSYEAGYFDQSHFIKEFKTFTGHTPKEFFKLSNYW